MGEAILRTRGLGHRHGEGPMLFSGLDVALAPGEVMAILGPNGQGKTTLMRLLAGVDRPHGGTVQRAAGARAAYVPQIARAGLAYRVLDVVVMGRAGHLPMFAWPSARDVARARAALDRVGAGALAERVFHTLSGGEKSLVLIARALTAEASILLLDEPMAALDLANQQVVLATLARIAREDRAVVVVTTHQPQHALALGGRVLVLDRDRGHVEGPADVVLDETLLARVYRLPVARVEVERGGRRALGAVPVFAMEAP
jgi:iron complex transport system ATP-binding protein